MELLFLPVTAHASIYISRTINRATLSAAQALGHRHFSSPAVWLAVDGERLFGAWTDFSGAILGAAVGVWLLFHFDADRCASHQKSQRFIELQDQHHGFNLVQNLLPFLHDLAANSVAL